GFRPLASRTDHARSMAGCPKTVVLNPFHNLGRNGNNARQQNAAPLTNILSIFARCLVRPTPNDDPTGNHARDSLEQPHFSTTTFCTTGFFQSLTSTSQSHLVRNLAPKAF